MPETPAAAFLRRIRSSSREWPHAAIVEHLLLEDPLALAPLTSRALVAAGLLLPTETARRRVAERIALAVVQDRQLPEDVSIWLDDIALDAVDSLRFDGLDSLAAGERAQFLCRLAACLGVHDRLGRDAFAALHALSPAQVAALRACLPSSWHEIELEGVDLHPDSQLASVTVRHIVRALRALE